MLFWKENIAIEKCTVCGLLRWQDSKVQGVKEGKLQLQNLKGSLGKCYDIFH